MIDDIIEVIKPKIYQDILDSMNYEIKAFPVDDFILLCMEYAKYVFPLFIVFLSYRIIQSFYHSLIR